MVKNMKLYRVWFKGQADPDMLVLAESASAAKTFAWYRWGYQYGDRFTKFKLRARHHLNIVLRSGVNRQLTKREYKKLKICRKCNMRDCI